MDTEDLRSNKLLRDVSDDVVERVVELAELVTFDAEQIIADEGESARYLYMLFDGSVRISKRGRGGQQETLTFLGPDDFFGEMALLDRQPRSARTTATQKTKAARIDADGLDELLGLAPVELSRNLINETTARLRKTNTHFIQEMMEAERLSLVGTMAATIIHDFKNPMSVIIGAAGLLEDLADDEQTNRIAGMIHRSVDRMLVMAQELLDFSRGTSNLELERVEIRSLMAELDEQALDGLADRPIEVEREVDYEGGLVIDRSRFLRLLLNLVKNAVEAMDEGGVLTVSVTERDDSVVFCVSDTGCGIPEDLLPTIFEPFVTSGKAKGTGLGMAIAKSIVEAHHGSIGVESTVGEGTRFKIVVPREQG